MNLGEVEKQLQDGQGSHLAGEIRDALKEMETFVGHLENKLPAAATTEATEDKTTTTQLLQLRLALLLLLLFLLLRLLRLRLLLSLLLLLLLRLLHHLLSEAARERVGRRRDVVPEHKQRGVALERAVRREHRLGYTLGYT